MSINRQDPISGILTGRLGVLGMDRHDKRPPSASDSMREGGGEKDERAPDPESLLSLASKDGGYMDE